MARPLRCRGARHRHHARVTGAGKTTGSQDVIGSIGAIRIRTDVERKRLHGLTAEARSGSALNAGLYSPERNERTYARLVELMRAVVAGGYQVVVDGTFLRRRERDRFRLLADELDVPFAIADFVAPLDTLRARVRRRQEMASDASEADVQVLEYQPQSAEPLTAGERELTVTCSADADPAETARLLAARWSARRHSA